MTNPVIESMSAPSPDQMRQFLTEVASCAQRPDLDSNDLTSLKALYPEFGEVAEHLLPEEEVRSILGSL